ncbi:uncharacterized protein LOC144922527 [Branchiostoma floridae x Branchiostoma belcheri]
MEKSKAGDDSDDEQDNDDESDKGATSGPMRSRIDRSPYFLYFTEVIKNTAFQIILKYIPGKWMDLGYQFGLTQHDINATYNECKGDPTACCKSVLEQWAAKYCGGPGAALMQLQMAVTTVGHKDVTEKIQKELCCFNNKDFQHPTDAFQTKDVLDMYMLYTSLYTDPQLIGYLDIMLSESNPYHAIKFLNALQGEINCSVQCRAMLSKSKEGRDISEALSAELEKNVMLKMQKWLQIKKEENACLERELQSKPAEGKMSGQLKVIETKSCQKNGDSGIGSTALSTRLSATHHSPGRATHHSPGRATHHSPGRATHHSPGRATHHSPGRATHHSPGRATHHSPGRATHHSPGRATHHSPGRATHHSPGRATHHSPGRATHHSPGRATHHSLGRATYHSPGRAENNVPPVNYRVQEEQSEHSSSDDDNYHTADDGEDTEDESPVQTANTSMQFSGVSIIQQGPGNIIINTGSDNTFNANVNVVLAQPEDSGDIMEPDTRPKDLF